MKKITLPLLILFSLGALAQTPPPLSLTSKSGIITVTNTTPKTILAYAFTMASNGHTSPMFHDYCFNPDGFPAGAFDTTNTVTDEYRATGRPTPQLILTAIYVQFTDGSSWGDPTVDFVSKYLSWRPRHKALYQNFLAAWQASGLAGLNAALDSAPATEPEVYDVRATRAMIAESGADTAIADVQRRLNAAIAHGQ